MLKKLLPENPLDGVKNFDFHPIQRIFLGSIGSIITSANSKRAILVTSTKGEVFSPQIEAINLIDRKPHYKKIYPSSPNTFSTFISLKSSIYKSQTGNSFLLCEESTPTTFIPAFFAAVTPENESSKTTQKSGST